MKQKIFIITGQSGSGKTTFLSHIIKELKKKGIQSGGFLAEGFWENNTRSHFELVNLITDEMKLFCTKIPQTGWEKIGQFYINPTAITFGETILDPDYLSQSDICVIDELGPFELKNKGWSGAVNRLLNYSSVIPMIWIVREQLLRNMVDYFGIEPLMIIQAEEYQLNEVVDKIISAIKTEK
jgi:iron complex transport system ATP-binding protein